MRRSAGRPGRPLGPLARLILAAIERSDAAAADIALNVAYDVRPVVRQLSRLVAAGHVEKLPPIARPPACRPVAVYRLARPRGSPSVFHLGAD